MGEIFLDGQLIESFTENVVVVEILMLLGPIDGTGDEGYLLADVLLDLLVLVDECLQHIPTAARVAEKHGFSSITFVILFIIWYSIYRNNIRNIAVLHRQSVLPVISVKISRPFLGSLIVILLISLL